MITVRAITPQTSIAARHGITERQFGEIVRLWHCGRDTYEIGKALDLKQEVVEAVLHAEREKRRRG